jgi:hypothetical protein
MNWKQTAANAIVTPTPAPMHPDVELAARLRAAMPNVPQRDMSFAMSLLSGFDRFGSFTERQRPYAQKFAALTATPSEPVWSHPATVQPPVVTYYVMPNICGLVNLDKFARLTVGKLQLSLKNDGSAIWVKWDSMLAGVIDTATGGFRAIRRDIRSEETHTAVLKALLDLEANPERTIREDGIRTGRCACCSRPLTDPVSIEFGIGPVCRTRGGW